MATVSCCQLCWCVLTVSLLTLATTALITPLIDIGCTCVLFSEITVRMKEEDITLDCNEPPEPPISETPPLRHRLKNACTEAIRRSLWQCSGLPLTGGERTRFGILWGLSLTSQDFEKYVKHYLKLTTALFS